MSQKVLIIAEAGVNHNGDLSIAKELIDIAAEAGADIVKFQTFSAEKLAGKTAPKAAYQLETTEGSESQYEMLKRLELARERHGTLMEYCAQRGIEFLSTGFDEDSIDFLAKIGVKRLKIPSGEIENIPYLRHAATKGLPIIISTGMSLLSEVEFAISTLETSGVSLEDVGVLHCNTQYPTPFNDVNLKAMETIRKSLPGIEVGYSDHTPGIEVPIAAVALGAQTIEKHFTLSREMGGPDHRASLEPDELKAMVAGIRNIELALGDGRKRPSPSEHQNREVVRKSIVARGAIQEGAIFSEENLCVKRPGTGVSPREWDNVIGRKACRSFEEDELIEW